jgi:hypothetical protein
MTKLKWRPELLREWLDDLTGESGRVFVLTPADLRRVADDALAAHELYGPLAELVRCRALQEVFGAMQPGPQRAAIVQEYLDRVGPAWEAAFKVMSEAERAEVAA